jgi:hypothetical protein
MPMKALFCLTGHWSPIPNTKPTSAAQIMVFHSPVHLRTQPGRPTEIFPQAYAYRQQEITYALDQIGKSPWADKRNIFLMGHSEGGIATAQSNHGGFRGIIISGWTCTNVIVAESKHPEIGGIHSPKDIPVLAIAYKDDVWRKGKNNEGRCADKADGRDLVQIDLEGNSHDTFGVKVAEDAVSIFLRQHLFI